MRQVAEFIAVLSCSLFTGAAVYVTFIEHPARMQCGVELAATEFAPSYRRATVLQAACARANATTIACKQGTRSEVECSNIAFLRSPACTRLSRTASISTAISDG